MNVCDFTAFLVAPLVRGPRPLTALWIHQGLADDEDAPPPGCVGGYLIANITNTYTLYLLGLVQPMLIFSFELHLS